MSQKLRPVLMLFLAALAPGCGSLDIIGLGGDPPDVAGGAPIRTDSSVYHVRTSESWHELTIGVTYTNPTRGPAYIPTCRTPHPPTLEKWEAGEWVTAYSPFVFQCLGPPVVIEAGATYAYTYRISASRRPNSYPRFAVSEIPGTYRLVWRILGTWTPHGPEPGLGEELPLEHRVSGNFRIE